MDTSGFTMTLNRIQTACDNEHIAFLQVMQGDTEVDEYLGTLYSFNRKHRSFCHPDNLPKEYEEYRVPLSYYEHGSCLWSLQGRGPNCRFDSVHLAGYWYPSNDMVAELPKEKCKQASFLQAAAAEFCTVYTHWANGETFEASLTVFKVLWLNREALTDPPTYNTYENCLLEDHRGGFLGSDIEENGMRSWIDEALEAIGTLGTVNTADELTVSWIEQLAPIISSYGEGGHLDVSEVDDLCKIIRAKVNLQQGNITDVEYEAILG